MNIFWETDKKEDSKPSPKPSSQPLPTAPPAPFAVPSMVPSMPIPTTSATDPSAEAEILGKITKALDDCKASMKGVDFYDFRKAMDQMASMGILDEATRFKAAFATLAAQGLSVDTLSNSAAIYLAALDKKEEAFKGYIANEKVNRVEAALKHAEDLKKQATDKAEMISKLTQEISEINRAELEARNLASQSNLEIDTLQNTFNSVKQRQADMIKMVVDRIPYYLTATPPAAH